MSLRPVTEVISPAGQRPGIPAALVRLVHDGAFAIALTDLDLRLIEASNAWCAETGMPRETVLGQSITSLFPAPEVPGLMRESLGGTRTLSPHIPITVDGRPAMYRLESAPWRHDDGELGGVMIFGRDITALVEHRLEMERSDRRLKMALEIDHALVWEKNLKTGEMYVTGSLIESMPELRTTSGLISLVTPEDRDRVKKAWRRHVRHGAPYEVELRHVRNDGSEVWLRNVQQLIRNDKGEPESILGVSKDITQRRESEAEIERLAFRDGLTGLSNRALFQRQFNEVVENAGHIGGGVGLIIVDVDHFKDVNDSYGHDTGDALLRSLAGLLTRAFRKTDIVARLGGDEFAVVLRDVATPQALLNPIETLLNLLRTPLEHNGRIFTVGASVGAALLKEGEDAVQLLKNADIALYEAKYSGRNRVVLFEPEMRTNVEGRVELLQQVRMGVLRNEFVLFYQPVIDVQANGVSGFEALMRWNHPERGVLGPEHFMAAFEDQDLSLKLGEVAFDQALMQMRSWLEQGVEFGRVAVNVSSAQFRNNKLAATVAAKLKHWGVPPEKLTIEVTENVYMGWSSNIVSDTINALHESGVMIALDDFGTGYASLANLRQFPIDRLKIDKSFVQNPDNDAIVKAVIGLGASMGMKVIAEGVECPEQLENLARHGCDQVQGFHFSRPIPAADVAQYVRQFTADAAAAKKIA